MLGSSHPLSELWHRSAASLLDQPSAVDASGAVLTLGGDGLGASRTETIKRLAAVICDLKTGHPTRVAVDGTTASGKSTLARELTDAVAAKGRRVIHLSMDGYHHPRQHRWQKGPLSAEGYYVDAYDFPAFVANVLVPLGPRGDRRFRERIIDLATDQAINEPAVVAPAGAVLIVDGSFLQRMELTDHWDYRIFVNARFDVALARGLARDSEALGGVEAARTAYQSRYHAAAHLYIADRHPADTASVIVDNDDLDAPSLRFPN
jgi:uridine kinase